MYAFRTEETRPFLWRTIQAEDERFLAQVKRFPPIEVVCVLVLTMNKQRNKMTPEDLLACIQAQMIYMIMRFVDGSHDPPELNQQLIRTYQVSPLAREVCHKGECRADGAQMLCKTFRRRQGDRFCELDSFIIRPTWEEWIFAESRRRTACVFFLICRCISISTGIEGCDAFSEFTNLPLPCPKGLWEARTRAEWEAEYTAYAALYGSGMHTMGMLIEAHKWSLENVSSAQLLDMWNARTDDLGQLLNIVTSMV
jgi:hypothetical protein